MGWDVGGVNLKGARLIAGAPPKVALEPFELQRAPACLSSTLAAVAQALGSNAEDHHAVTMTAELSHTEDAREAAAAFVGKRKPVFKGR